MTAVIAAIFFLEMDELALGFTIETSSTTAANLLVIFISKLPHNITNSKMKNTVSIPINNMTKALLKLSSIINPVLIKNKE
jgi:hypothetical protein